jgi:hypothetical protein
MPIDSAGNEGNSQAKQKMHSLQDMPFRSPTTYRFAPYFSVRYVFSLTQLIAIRFRVLQNGKYGFSLSFFMHSTS